MKRIPEFYDKAHIFITFVTIIFNKKNAYNFERVLSGVKTSASKSFKLLLFISRLVSELKI